MLYRKITSYIEDHLKSGTDKILILEGARQIGKSFSIREVGTRLYKNFIEVKSGKDYTVHSALNNLLGNPDYHIPSATVLSSECEISHDGKVTYMPVYFVMFMESDTHVDDESEYTF